jgi:hypothetical protein
LVSCNETQTSETKCTEVCRSNYPVSKAYGGTIPLSGGYNTPQLALGFIPVIDNQELLEEMKRIQVKMIKPKT